MLGANVECASYGACELPPWAGRVEGRLQGRTREDGEMPVSPSASDRLSPAPPDPQPAQSRLERAGLTSLLLVARTGGTICAERTAIVKGVVSYL